MLGADFRKEEIEQIIREADTSNDGKISYSEFLALWEDHNDAEQDDSEQASESNIREKPSTFLSRAAFLNGQQLSERSRKNAVEGNKKVGFLDGIVTIPTTDC